VALEPNTALAEHLRETMGENAYLCFQCSRCTSGCPTAATMSIPPARMMRMAQLGQEDQLLSDPSIWRCLGCDTCTEHCPYGVSTRKLIEHARQETMQTRFLAGRTESFEGDEALSRGVHALGALGERVLANYNVSGEDNESRLAWTSNLESVPEGIDRNKNADTVYFVGCVSAMFPMSYSIPQSFAGVLRKTGVDFTTLGPSEWCCGFPLLMAGQLEQARELMKHNVAEVRSLGASRVVMTCPSCYYMWKHRYTEELGIELGFEVQTASELIAGIAEHGELPVKEAARPGVVTYHDPCDMGRKAGLYDEPRSIISSIPGLTLVEMEQSREHALCCGGGGDIETFDPEITGSVAARRIAQAQAVGATQIISACPQCVRTLSKAARAAKVRIRVTDLVQLVDASLED
jgi:heterodisulfide reductase subunit D